VREIEVKDQKRCVEEDERAGPRIGKGPDGSKSLSQSKSQVEGEPAASGGQKRGGKTRKSNKRIGRRLPR